MDVGFTTVVNWDDSEADSKPPPPLSLSLLDTKMLRGGIIPRRKTNEVVIIVKCAKSRGERREVRDDNKAALGICFWGVC
jgi:hypothetical protein